MGKLLDRMHRMLLILWMVWILPPAGPRGFAADEPATRKTLLVLGDSLAAGYGLDPSEAFPARLQELADQARIPVTVVNAGVSGDTTAGGLRRLDWLLRRPVDVLLIELGGNDGLRGLAPEATRTNLTGIVRRVRERQPGVEVILAGMQMPPNMGEAYGTRFREVFPEVAQAEGIELIPFLLEGVGGVPELNLPDQIHPTAAGHRLIASNIWITVEPVLRRVAAR